MIETGFTIRGSNYSRCNIDRGRVQTTAGVTLIETGFTDYRRYNIDRDKVHTTAGLTLIEAELT